jgi:hypothetical protein
MNRRFFQKGVSPISVLVVGAIAAFLLILGMRAVPAWNEYFAVKRAITEIAANANPQTATVPELRRQFDMRSSVDDISTIKGADLQFSKQGGKIVIAATYERRIPLVANASIVFDFVATSQDE